MVSATDVSDIHRHSLIVKGEDLPEVKSLAAIEKEEALSKRHKNAR